MKPNHHRVNFKVGNSSYIAQVPNYVYPKKYEYTKQLDGSDLTASEKKDIVMVTENANEYEEEQIEKLIEDKKDELKKHRGE